MFQNIDQLRDQYQAQLDTLNRMKIAQQTQGDILGEIQREMSEIKKEDLEILSESPEYKGAKGIYESGFLQFISNKFSGEYVSTPEGHEAAVSLLNAIKDSKEKIAYQSKVRAEKINKVLEFLEKDPEMRKRYTELTQKETNNG